MVMADREYFLPYERCPWFEKAPAKDVFNMTFDGEDLRWPALDVDLEIDSLRHPERYPLIYR